MSLGNGVKSVEQELDVLQSDYTDRAYGVQAKLEDYYNRVISLLTDKDAYEQVIFVARLALINLLTVRIVHSRLINLRLEVHPCRRPDGNVSLSFCPIEHEGADHGDTGAETASSNILIRDERWLL
jgi:hypothetical protein